MKKVRKSQKKSTERSAGRKREQEEVNKSNIVAAILTLLIAGVGLGGYLMLKLRDKPQSSYVVTSEEKDQLKKISLRASNVQLDPIILNYLIQDSNKFLKQYSVAQIVKVGDNISKFQSPNISSVKMIKEDAVEGVIRSRRDKLRLKDYKRILSEKKDLDNQRILDGLENERKKNAAAAQKASFDNKQKFKRATIAEGIKLDQTKEQVRWEILDGDMFERSMFKPLDGKYRFDFIQASKRLDPWLIFNLEGQRAWGNEMLKIIKSAEATYGLIANSGTDHKNWIFIYEKQKGTLRLIDKSTMHIKVVDAEGKEKKLSRPIIDIQPDEFWRLVTRAILSESLKASVNASKSWAALKEIHPNKSDEQVLKFGYASLMYCIKQFPASKKMIKSISEVSTEVLKSEIAFVEPGFNNREMLLGLDIVEELIKTGFRTDALMILSKMKERFDFTEEWAAMTERYNKLHNEAEHIKKN